MPTNGGILNKYQKLKADGKLFGTIKRAVKLAEERFKSKPSNEQSLYERFLSSRILVPLGFVRTKSCEEMYKAYPRRKNWTHPTAGFKNDLVTNDLGTYSSRCKYRKYTYTVIIQSFARIINGKLWFHFDGKTYIKPAPYGYYWDNSNGIRIVSCRNHNIEYHVSAQDLISKKWYSDIRIMAVSNYETRRYILRQEKRDKKLEKKKQSLLQKRIKEAIKSDCYVTLKDSIKSGNCNTGTINWAISHGIKGNYTKLTSIVDSLHDERVKIVAITAMSRHKKSLELGYSPL